MTYQSFLPTIAIDNKIVKVLRSLRWLSQQLTQEHNCPMILHFNCPETGKSFETTDYSISDNRGIATKSNGEKILDANVVINSPCPHCGNLHKYRADKLACPFSPE